MVYGHKESIDSENEGFFLAGSSPTCHMLGSAETASPILMCCFSSLFVWFFVFVFSLYFSLVLSIQLKIYNNAFYLVN